MLRFIFTFLCLNLFTAIVIQAQNVLSKYQVESILRTELMPDPLSPDKLSIDLIVISERSKYLLITTKLSDKRNKDYIQADESIMFIDLNMNLIYSIGENSEIKAVENLKIDSLQKIEENIIVQSYRCDLYQIKDNSGIKIYASKELPDDVNPGIKTNLSAIGGIIKIEIIKKSQLLTFVLIDTEKTDQKLTNYIDLTKKSKRKPVGFKSILRN